MVLSAFSVLFCPVLHVSFHADPHFVQAVSQFSFCLSQNKTQVDQSTAHHEFDQYKSMMKWSTAGTGSIEAAISGELKFFQRCVLQIISLR